MFNEVQLKKHAEDMMVELMHDIAQVLLDRVRSGEATNQDISNAIKLLQNNGITVTVNKGDPLDVLSKDLPFESDILQPLY